MKINITKAAVLLIFLRLFTTSALAQVTIQNMARTDVITAAILEDTNGAYTNFSKMSFGTETIYTGNTAQYNNLIKLRHSDQNYNYSGIVTTSPSKSKIKSIKIEWDNQTKSNLSIAIYGRKAPYTSISDLYKDYKLKNPICTIKKGDNKIHQLTTDYQNIGILAIGGIVYLKDIKIEWEKLQQNIKFPLNIYKIKFGTNFISPTINNAIGNLVYSSSDTGVATIDSKTGKVDIIGTGTTTISATTEESDKYKQTTAQYKLYVLSGEQYESTFNFWAPQDLSTPYQYLDVVKNECSLTNKDIMASISDGDEPSKFVSKNGSIHLHIAYNGKIFIQAPRGFLIETIKTNVPKSQARISFNENYGEIASITKSGAHISNLSIQYNGTYKLKIGNSGYATFSSQHPYILPNGLMGSIVTIDPSQKSAIADFCLQPGNIIGAQQGILIKGDPGEYTLRIANEQGKQFNEQQNCLRPVASNNLIHAPAGKQLLILAKPNGKNIGFYLQKGSKEGDCIRNLTNKAYLEIPKNLNGTQGLKLELREPTGIAPTYSSTNKKGINIYTPLGTHVGTNTNNLPKGIYITQGKKFFVK